MVHYTWLDITQYVYKYTNQFVSESVLKIPFDINMSMVFRSGLMTLLVVSKYIQIVSEEVTVGS